MKSWIRREAIKWVRGAALDVETRKAIESRAQLAVAEVAAAAAQREDAIRNAIERRAQLAVHEANAMAEQRGKALRHDIEARAQLAVAEASARSDLKEQAWRTELESHVRTAVASAVSRLGEELELLQDKVERNSGPAAGGASVVQGARGGGAPVAHGPGSEAFWSPALTWAVEAGKVQPDGLGATAAQDFAQALTELGHDVQPTGGSPAVRALVSSKALPGGPSASDATLLVGFDWGESGYSLTDMERVNTTLAGVACASRHAERVLIDHGIAVPTATVGVGIDGWERVAMAPAYQAPGKSFRFLHVSDCDAASGVDLLLEAFGRVFASDDAVSLIVRPTGTVPEHVTATLKALRGKNRTYPEVIVLTDALTDSELKALYCRCHVFLAPSRAGGFGLPIAHALLSGLPVVVTAWGGHMDYCRPENAWLVDYEFQDARTSDDLIASVWAEPLPKALDEALWLAFRAEPAERFAKAWSGRKHLLEQATWRDVALRVARLAHRQRHDSEAAPKTPRIGFVTTWNTKCGIATYSGHLLEGVPLSDYVIFAAKQEDQFREDERNCIRCWKTGIVRNELENIYPYLNINDVSLLYIQFNYGFFNGSELSQLISFALGRGIPVVVELHSTIDPQANRSFFQLADHVDMLARCTRLLVHAPVDLNRMKALGLVDNVSLLTHAVLDRRESRPARSLSESGPLITTFGFCLPDKGLVEIVHAVALLKAAGLPVRLRMLNAEYPDAISANEIEKVRAAINDLGLHRDVDLHTEFLDDEACLAMLGEADLLVNPYQRSNESASGAVRYGLAAGCPVLVTPLPIFEDLGASVFRSMGTTPRDLAEAIEITIGHLTSGTKESFAVAKAANKWVDLHNVARQSERVMRSLRALAAAQPADR